MWTLEEQKFREAYLNAKLAQKWLEPELHPWAALDFAGVEFADDACSKHIQHYGKVCVPTPFSFLAAGVFTPYLVKTLIVSLETF